MHSVTFGLELRIPPKDSLTHTAAAARARTGCPNSNILQETCSPLPTSQLGV